MSYRCKLSISKTIYNLILSSNISENSVVTGNSYLGNSIKLKKIAKEDIIFCSRGAQFGRVTIFPEVDPQTITNIDNMHIINTSEKLFGKIFISQFLRYLRRIKHLYKITIFGNGSYSFTKYHLEELLFPNFPDSIKMNIAKLYNNKNDKISNINFGNYFEKEKSRNKELGIFQLNRDIDTLKQIIENLVYKIVMLELIAINLKY